MFQEELQVGNDLTLCHLIVVGYRSVYSQYWQLFKLLSLQLLWKNSKLYTIYLECQGKLWYFSWNIYKIVVNVHAAVHKCTSEAVWLLICIVDELIGMNYELILMNYGRKYTDSNTKES